MVVVVEEEVAVVWVVVVGIAEVGVEPILAGEGFATRPAHKGFITSVDATVTTPLCLVAEQLPAIRTGVNSAPPSPALPRAAASPSATATPATTPAPHHLLRKQTESGTDTSGWCRAAFTHSDNN